MTRVHLAAVAAAVLIGGSRLHGTVIAPADLPELVAEATTIVQGRVVGAESRAVPGERSIETLVTIAADEYLKGAQGSHVTIRVPGGQIGDRRYVMIGAPVLRAGDEVILFLRSRGPSVPWILGLNQGVFRIRSDSRLAARRERLSGDVRIVESMSESVRSMAPGPAGAVPLEAFKTRIRRLVAEGGHR
ncbi:MAG TPA: hypothetical protein VNK41_09120 [Vicinamibacterales bacterium]|nr:hypothetical protein [Vicinamibacterales bacterium]